VTRVDNQLVEIIDVEKVLAEVAPTPKRFRSAWSMPIPAQGVVAAGADGR
jgi:hypothetical protein